MSESGYGHAGRIPSYGSRGQPDNRGNPEPPACIQNAMMTKDKKPFTYTPGGLDLSQIKTPSMARRLARQRSQEEHEQAYSPQQGVVNGGGVQPPRGGQPPPPPFQGGPPPPPPPPPLVIHAPDAQSARPETIVRPIGERPEIVIPENPIGMLRKTNSPYHWEQEKADKERLGDVPKFAEKAPSPLLQQYPPAAFSQQPPTTYTPQIPNNVGRQNYPYNTTVNQSPESPLHKPEPQYPSKTLVQSPGANIQHPTRDILQRQDSQFNKSPTPFGPHGVTASPVANGSPISPGPNSAWRQPERQSPAVNNASPQQRSPFSPTNSSPQFVPGSITSSPVYQNENAQPNIYNTLPRACPRIQDNYASNVMQSPPKNNVNNPIFSNIRNERAENPKVDITNTAPWRSNTINKNQREENNNFTQASNNQNFNNPPFYRPNENQAPPNNVQQNPWIAQQQQQQPQQNNTTMWKPQQPQQSEINQRNSNLHNEPNQWEQNQKKEKSPPVMPGQVPGEVRYQTRMQIPVTPRKPQQQGPERPQPQPQPQPNREAVYVTQEPVYYHQGENQKSVPPFVKAKDKTPPPEWVQRPLDGRKSLTRELRSPQREPIEPIWIQKSNEMRNAARELSSPPLTQQNVQPPWSTKPSDNRKSLPRDTQPTFHHGTQDLGSRGGPIQMQVSSKQVHDQNGVQGNQQPQLRIIIDMNQNPQVQNQQAQPPYSQPTQRIMRVLSPQLVRMDHQDIQCQTELPSLNNSQPKTRIIPIQLEGGGSEAPNRSVYYHQFTYEGPPRQSKAFRVLQTITNTLDMEDIQNMEEKHGFSDL